MNTAEMRHFSLREKRKYVERKVDYSLRFRPIVQDSPQFHLRTRQTARTTGNIAGYNCVQPSRKYSHHFVGVLHVVQ